MNLHRVVGSYQPENIKAHIMLEAWEHNEMNNSPSSWFLKRWTITVLLLFPEESKQTMVFIMV